MTSHSPQVGHFDSHGPENAEFELKKAYNCVIEAQTTLSPDKAGQPFIRACNNDLLSIYKTAFRAYRDKNRLAAERWARTAKHLSRAVWHEAKIAYLESHATDLPFLEGASAEEYNLHEGSDTTEDLLNSVASHIPPGQNEITAQMQRYLERGREHLNTLNRQDYTHELLRAERIKAAHEFGRVLECMELAYEAQAGHPKAA